MGLREDFRKALASIAAAVPEGVQIMRHGEDESGDVVQASSREFIDSVNESAPVQVTRFVANAADFPTLGEGSAVELGDSLRVVVALKTDPVGATLTLGLSAEFEKHPATYQGTRRVDGAVRNILTPLDVLLLEGGTADNYADALAPTYATSYTVGIRTADWLETTDPQPSDTIEVSVDGYPVALKVSAVTRHGGWIILKCRTRS